MKWVHKVMIMPLSLVSALLFPGCVVGDPTPSSSSKHVFPLEIFDYPEMAAFELSYSPLNEKLGERVTFVTPEDVYCVMTNNSVLGDGVECSGDYEDYIPWNTYVKAIRDPKKDHTPGKCLTFSIRDSDSDFSNDGYTSVGSAVDCHKKNKYAGRLDPGYKVTFDGNVCGLTWRHELACVSYSTHGFVLKPHHQSWVF